MQPSCPEPGLAVLHPASWDLDHPGGIGVFLEPTTHTCQLELRPPVIRRYVSTAWSFVVCVPWSASYSASFIGGVSIAIVRLSIEQQQTPN
jgi:hypothetical protein